MHQVPIRQATAHPTTTPTHFPHPIPTTTTGPSHFPALVPTRTTPPRAPVPHTHHDHHPSAPPATVRHPNLHPRTLHWRSPIAVIADGDGQIGGDGLGPTLVEPGSTPLSALIVGVPEGTERPVAPGASPHGGTGLHPSALLSATLHVLSGEVPDSIE